MDEAGEKDDAGAAPKAGDAGYADGFMRTAPLLARRSSGGSRNRSSARTATHK